ncbi:hypothetical protein HPB47_023558 [Ixodes persulcatus]|uniref:Uncharacterized protein n=1 Tax=Ixodes persulcatus TaxID=34615 RepID=A0AC60Q9Z0_IXOPE|nr:hypothetical protein HPB47_023558 [Ixodes persulcatus]
MCDVSCDASLQCPCLTVTGGKLTCSHRSRFRNWKMDLEFYADYNAAGHFPAQTCLKSMSSRKNKVPKQIKFQLDLPTRGDLMGGDSGGGALIPPENIKREIPDEPCLPSGPRSLGSMQKVPSLSDLSEESSLGSKKREDTVGGRWGGGVVYAPDMGFLLRLLPASLERDELPFHSVAVRTDLALNRAVRAFFVVPYQTLTLRAVTQVAPCTRSRYNAVAIDPFRTAWGGSRVAFASPPPAKEVAKSAEFRTESTAPLSQWRRSGPAPAERCDTGRLLGYMLGLETAPCLRHPVLNMSLIRAVPSSTYGPDPRSSSVPMSDCSVPV